jgi:hypothetical protein
MPFRSRIGTHQELLIVGDVCVASPDLLTGDDEFVAIYPTPGRDAGQIRSGARFGEALAPHLLAGKNRRKMTPPLLFAASGD